MIMRTMNTARFPSCHLSHISGPAAAAPRTAVWICEYPYRTMRLDGPSSEECGECPVFQSMKCGTIAKAAPARPALPEIQPEQPALRPAV
jgi:hypothetical protein